jgi:aminoacrylate hydrolase
MSVYHFPCQQHSDQTVVLSSGLGGHAHYWTPQIQMLSQHFHVLCYDHEGIAADSAPLAADYSLQHLARQLAEILKQRQLSHCYFVGHALGAFIGLELARLDASLLDRLVLINAWEALDAHTNKCFEARLSLLQHAGVEAYVRAQALFLYPPQWISSHAEQIQAQEQQQIAQFAPANNVYARIAALRRYHAGQIAAQIAQPCLLLVNQDDFLVPWQRGVALAKQLPNAQLCLMPSGAHASNITQAAQVNAEILQFLCAVPA